MSAPTASIEVLKKSLEANGLSTSGTKVEMLQRLLHNKGDGRKGGGKVKAEKKMPAITSITKNHPAFEAFAESERTTLIASGITDEAALKEEIDRRWSVLQSLKPAPPKPVAATSRKMEVVLDASQLAELNLIYAGPTTDGMHMYIDKPAAAAPAAAAGKKKKDAASPSKEGDDVVASPPGTAMASAEKAAMKVAFSSKKRKPDEEEEQPAEDEPDMKWACQIATMRLLKKAKKEHLIPLLEDFGVPTKGSKEELSTLLAEQLHYETDAGDDE